MKDTVLCIQTSKTCSTLQSSSLAQLFNLILVDDYEQALKLCASDFLKVASIILGSTIKDPIQTAQRLHAIDKSSAIIILSTQEKLSVLIKSLRFTPFLSSLTTCLLEESEDLISEINRFSDYAIKQRDSKVLTTKLNRKISALGTKHAKTHNSKDYIERLFDAAPIGIVTLSSAGEIFALNNSASKMFRISESQCLGQTIQFIFPGLLLVPDRVENITLERGAVTLHFEVTITTISGKDNTPGYLLLISDVSERKKYENALKKAVSVRDEFLSIASHELRTPLTSLKLQLQLAERVMNSSDPEISIPRLQKSTNIALFQVERLSKLVDDLLDTSRVETGKLSLSFEEIDIADLLKQAIERSSEVAKTAKCLVRYEGPQELKMVADYSRLDQVIINLLMNAFKYASGSNIIVRLSASDQQVKINVIDFGMGIESDKIPFIFDRYERAISHNNISGLGLGLYISKNIVEEHNGKITVISEIDKGTTFQIELPRFKHTNV